MSPELLIWVRWTLAGVMFVASLGKLLDRDSFIQAVINYKILHRGISRIFARIVPWAEILSAILLVSGPLTYLGALITGVLLLSFTTAAAINLIRGRDISCGCMGKLITDRVGWPLLLRNAILIGLVCLAIPEGTKMINLAVASWFPMGSLIVSAVFTLTLFGPGIDFLRAAFFVENKSDTALLKG